MDTKARGSWRWVRWTPLGLLLGVVLVWLSAFFLLDGMGRVTLWYAGQVGLSLVSGLVFLLTGGYWLTRRRWTSRACISTLVVSALGATLSTLWTFGLLPVRYPADASAYPGVVRVPLDGPVRVAWGGSELEHNYHAATPDQRWAYDLMVEPYFTQSTNLEDYGCYGRDVLAPGSGAVTVARDGLPDHVPGAVSNDTQNPTGNTVAIHLDDGGYLVIAHLASGSVAVDEGARVEEGQRLGACGNSGNTSEPHVHIHLQRQDPAVVPHGFAVGLPLHFRDHDGPEMPNGGLEIVDGEIRATGDVITHQPTPVEP